MKWVTIWGNAQSTVLPAPATYAKDITLRYPIFVPFSGKKLRITLDNFCSTEDIEIEELTIGFGKTLSDEQGEIISLTYQKKKQMRIPAHQSIQTDPIEIFIPENCYLIISFYLKEYTLLTSGVDIIGPLSKGYFAYGNQLLNKTLDINTSKSTSWVYFLANIDLYTEDQNHAIICYGDSITSQDWPDYLLLELRKRNINRISVVRKAVSGTRILREYSCITYQSYGKCGKKRFSHEITSVSGATTIIIQHGINDIIHPVGTNINPFRPLSDLPTTTELIEGLKEYSQFAKKENLTVFFGTLLPIYNWRTYAPFREVLKNEVNSWIRMQPHIDFEAIVGCKIEDAVQFKESYDSGDHLHPSKKAYQAMGEAMASFLIEQKKI